MENITKAPAEKLKAMGFVVTEEDNYVHPPIKEIISENGEYTLSYLPKAEKDWAGLGGMPDDWGWGILNNEEGYLIEEKNYQDNLDVALEDFIDILLNGEKS